MATKSGRLRWVLYVFAGMVALLGVLLATKSRADIPLETLKQRWATGSSRFMELDGMEVHYRDEGSGAPIAACGGASVAMASAYDADGSSTKHVSGSTSECSTKASAIV